MIALYLGLRFHPLCIIISIIFGVLYGQRLLQWNKKSFQTPFRKWFSQHKKKPFFLRFFLFFSRLLYFWENYFITPVRLFALALQFHLYLLFLKSFQDLSRPSTYNWDRGESNTHFHYYVFPWLSTLQTVLLTELQRIAIRCDQVVQLDALIICMLQFSFYVETSCSYFSFLLSLELQLSN